MATNYASPLDQLLTLGEPAFGHTAWRDYPADFGLTPRHIPELIRLLTDEDLLEADQDKPEVYAQVHAWRALGQLRAAAAAPALIDILDEMWDDDWTTEDLPTVLGLIGPTAIPALEAYLTDVRHPPLARSLAGDALAQIGLHHPLAVGRCVALLHRQLQQYADQDQVLNADLVHSLLELHAAGALPTIVQAYEAGAVDELFISWSDVLDTLGDAARRLRPDYEEDVVVTRRPLEAPEEE